MVSKFIERIVYDQADQADKFLLQNYILYKYLSEFWKNHSLEFCLSAVKNKISTRFYKGIFTGMILINLQKVFDTINHEIDLLFNAHDSCLTFQHEDIQTIEQ